MPRLTFLAGMCCLLLGGCTIQDSDKCVDGLQYDKEMGACVDPEEGATDTNGNPSDGGAGDSGPSDAGEVTGIGEPCTVQENCADYYADYCIKDPSAEQGACTVQNCPQNACPALFLCCKCPDAFGIPSICIGEEDTGELEKMTCSCT